MISADKVREMIEQGLPGAQVSVRDPYNDQTHLEATIVFEGFRDKNRIQQHRMVYQALGDAFDGPLHALALKTEPPQN